VELESDDVQALDSSVTFGQPAGRDSLERCRILIFVPSPQPLEHSVQELQSSHGHCSGAHACVHVAVFCSLLGQSEQLLFSNVLVRSFVPLPHVTEHLDHAPQSPK